MSYEIKKLTPNDLAPARQFIVQLHIENGGKEQTELSGKYLSDVLLDANFHVFVAIENDVVMGGLIAYELPMFAKEEKEMFLYDIVVLERCRRRGIATELINSLKTICREKGIRIIFVGTSRDSEAAIGLYTATGGKREDIPWFIFDLEKEQTTGGQ